MCLIIFKSLSLCTALIVFTLTQDNLSIDIDDSTFNLILSFLQFNEQNSCIKDLDNGELADKFSYLIDLASNSCHMNNQKNGSQSNDEISSSDANDDLIVYKKIYSKCKKIYDHIHSDTLTKEHNILQDIHFNCALLTLDCLLNMNQNMKKNIVLNDFYKNEMREKFVIDKILIRSKLILKSLINLKTQSEFEFTQSGLGENTKFLFLLGKLKSCINLIETLTQPISHSKSTNTGITNNLKSIKYKEDDEDGPLESNQLNQNYMVDLKNRFVIEFIKESLNFFDNQISMLLSDRTKFESSAETDQIKSKVLNYLVNALKEQFLFLISLTQNNEYVSKKLIADKEFVGMLFKFLINESKAQSILFKLANENDQFDLLIMLLGILLNLFVNCFKDKVLLNLIKYKNKEVNITALEIVLKLYQAKENLVRIAENDQENEFNQLNEHIESQNIENINVAIMNSIHKAGKHMEDHIIAAHSGLIIGYMLFIDDTFNNRNYIQIDSVQAKLKNKAFTSMVQIIRKFIIFMKMMKVSGFSADKYLEMVLGFLENLEN
ncbi:wings apart -like protein [Brachionus plicatilis]|uniref:Wings apart-like protein n=1 Tax=Brachionus plicatilis TaxID=10195 RepID=A0A3M7RHE4_BRAPC|nr:wings apart -like protein [Brachionus plicatilis]